MKKLSFVAAAALGAAGIVAVAGASPAQACAQRSGYNVETVQVIPQNHPLSPSSNGPVYIDFRKSDMDTDGTQVAAGVYPTYLVKHGASDPAGAALDVFFAPQSFWMYVETNGRDHLQNGYENNPAYVALENDDADCGGPSNPDTVIY